MTFTKIGTILAILIVVGGVFVIFTGIVVDGAPELAGRYFSSKTTAGQRIDQGIITIGIGIAAGVLTEISRSLAKLVAREDAK